MKQGRTRVLVFIGSLTGGGAERVAVVVSEFLAARGYPVTLVTMFPEDRDFFTINSNVKRRCIGLVGANRGVRKVTANIQRVRALRKIVKEEHAQVVIGMMSSSAIIAILACIGLDTRVVASERNFPGRKSLDRIWSMMRKLTYPLAAAHVVQTSETADWLVKNTRARNVHIIPNSVRWPIPGGAPIIEPKDVIDPSRRVILASGSKIDQKGFDLLLQAFSEVSVERGNWDLVIIGLTSSRGKRNHENIDLPSFSNTLSISDRVFLPGRVGNVDQWYQRATMFVLSSRYEGFPNVLLEAMASGCACVAFDCDTGPRDIIAEEVNGLLVPAEDVDALGAAMVRLMDDEALRCRLASAATIVRQRFSEERILGKWQQLIDLLAC